MSEKLVEAFARGLMSALVGTKEKEPGEKKPRVIKTDDVKAAVESYLGPLLAAEEPVSGQQLDMMFGQTDVQPDEMAENLAYRVNMERIERAQREAQNRATYDPNTGMQEGGSTASWSSPPIPE